MSITVLSQETINKIAAGEVVERPLNVVKELTENSLDACASSINIEINQAGRKLIRISDNGIGMEEDDLKLSILSHATSKISNFEDLSHIQSLGFRGEALASIAAVSKFEIKTKSKNASSGWKLSCQGGKNVEIEPWSGACGTIAQVSDLFFNTPARQKFLKSDATERGRIINIIEEIALANQDVSFKLSFDDKNILSTTASGKKKETISDILGKDFANILNVVQIEHDKAAFDIYYTGIDNAQPNRKYQYLFVNSRPVNLPKWLIHCINRAYQGLIMHDRYPGFLIYITIDPCDIDVNIHPTKRDIKFVDEGAMYDIILKTFKGALTSKSYSQIDINSEQNSIKTFDLDAVKGDSKTDNNQSFSHDGAAKNPFVYENKKNYGSFKNNYSMQDYANIYVKQKEFAGDVFDKNIKVLGQAFENYIVVESEGKLYIFDQHAAAERIKYELYLKQAADKKINLQTMLLPETFELSSSLSALLKENLSLMNELGIEIEEFGLNTFRIKAYPSLLGDMSMENIVKALIEDLDKEKGVEIEKKREKIIRMACRSSIKAGYNISNIEAKQLISDLFKCKRPLTCPHGRPTAYSISKEELEKFFKRV
ncbi:MAG: DNA mismatch repair endonuclease MutL [Elusimicrobiota bacterium]|jgi:DNA mismatch repair protein MutL|nr:DNA mismatch repair endonuclease MutL [Elusimicrobiota bacterium]